MKSGWHRGSKAKLYSSLTEEDTKRQALNVYRMRLLGAEVIPVTSGTGTLKDAVSEAMREWTSRISDTHYCLGSVMGPHPFPTIVRDFQAVISKEIKEQLLEKRRAAFIPFSALCSYFICGVSFRCRVDLRYSSSVWLTTELAVLENASPNVRQQAGSSGRDTTPGQPNACITSSCEMVTPSPLRTNAMMRVSSRKLYEIFGFTGHLSIRCWMSLSQPGVSIMSGY